MRDRHQDMHTVERRRREARLDGGHEVLHQQLRHGDAGQQRDGKADGKNAELRRHAVQDAHGEIQGQQGGDQRQRQHEAAGLLAGRDLDTAASRARGPHSSSGCQLMARRWARPHASMKKALSPGLFFDVSRSGGA
jgi:hypothetical protein